MLSPLKLGVTLAIALSSTAQAAEIVKIVDVSRNLYYSGLIPEKYSAPFSGAANPYYGSLIPPKGYPQAPIPFNRYVGTPIGDCLRNVFYVDNNGNERAPNTAAGEKENSYGPDYQTGCFGKPPLVVKLADLGLQAGDMLYIAATGLIDDNSGFNFGPGPVDPRGQANSSGAFVNHINQYAVSALFAKANAGHSMPETDAQFKQYVDASWSHDETGLSLIGAPGFEVVKLGSLTEIALVEDLKLNQTNALTDNDGVPGPDQGTAEFAGSVQIPDHATHIVLAYNTAKGGFYHHGDPVYFGAENPLLNGSNGTWPGITQARLVKDNILYLDGTYRVPTPMPDQFPDDGIDAEPGDPWAAGVFKIRLSDQPVVGEPALSLPVARFTTRIDGLTVQLDASASSVSTGSLSSYSWDFGDGSAQANGVTATHRYANQGNYTITLTVQTASNQHDSTSSEVDLSSASVEPAAEEETAPLSTSSSGGGGALGALLLAFGAFAGYRRQRRR